MDELIHDIYNIIPAYYDEKEARQIKELIIKYIAEVISDEVYEGFNL